MASVDIGIGGLFDRVERHFGKLAVAALTGLAGTAVAAICLSVSWQYAAAPLLNIYLGHVPSQISRSISIAAGATSIIFGLYVAFRFHKLATKLSRAVGEIEEKTGEMVQRHQQMGEQVAVLHELIDMMTEERKKTNVQFQNANRLLRSAEEYRRKASEAASKAAALSVPPNKQPEG